MNKLKRIFILILSLCFLVSSNVFAQNQSSTVQANDTLWYLNGDFEEISDYEFVEEGRILNYKNRKGKHRDVETFFLFSINKADGTTEMLYAPNMEEEVDTLTVEEMNSFRIGGFLANKNYKAKGALVGGIALGFASTVSAGGLKLNAMLIVLPPVVKSVIIGVTNPSEKKLFEAYPHKSKDIMFVEGYKQSAKRKRTKKSIVGGLIGIAAGIVPAILLYAK